MKSICLLAPNPEDWVQKRRAQLSQALIKRGLDVHENPGPESDLCVCFGGDGSLLAGIRKMGELRTQIPVTGIHCSRGLGFLHPLVLPPPEESLDPWAEAFAKALSEGQYEIQKRWGLCAQLERNSSSPEQMWAMNDFVFSKGTLSRMVRLEVQANKTPLFKRLRGDGLIISSATGSTAYSFSAGGPVIAPELGTILLTPICPHEISQRPILLGPSVEVSVEVVESKSAAYLTQDGQSGFELEPGARLQIRKSDEPVKWWIPTTSQLAPKNYYEILREKLGFGRQLNAP